MLNKPGPNGAFGLTQTCLFHASNRSWENVAILYVLKVNRISKYLACSVCTVDDFAFAPKEAPQNLRSVHTEIARVVNASTPYTHALSCRCTHVLRRLYRTNGLLSRITYGSLGILSSPRVVPVLGEGVFRKMPKTLL